MSKNNEVDEALRLVKLANLKLRMIIAITRDFDSDPPELKKVWPI